MEVGAPSPSPEDIAGTQIQVEGGTRNPNIPNVVLEYKVTVTTTTTQISSGTQNSPQTTTSVVRTVGFYNHSGLISEPIPFKTFQKAVTKINNH